MWKLVNVDLAVHSQPDADFKQSVTLVISDQFQLDSAEVYCTSTLSLFQRSLNTV